jgi:hypothetical protein
MKRWNKAWTVVLMMGALPAACAPQGPAAITPGILPTAAPSRTAAATETAAATINFSATPSPTAPLPKYADIPLPGVERLREIYRAGERSGMRAGVFSKVGDSLTANGMFLVPFGAGDYSLGEYGYLQEAIDFYSRETARTANSFANDSLAARTGWRAGHVLDPAKARSPCEPGESPLACGFRIVRPAAVVIMLGTNDAMSPAGDFREAMRRIVAFALDRGVIPILTTIPELRGQGVGPYNAAIRDPAVEWEIPWIDLHAALTPLPNQGLGPDGIHLSWVEPAVFEPQYLQHRMTMRNLLTLQALDAVWRSYPPGIRGINLPLPISSPVCFE